MAGYVICFDNNRRKHLLDVIETHGAIGEGTGFTSVRECLDASTACLPQVILLRLSEQMNPNQALAQIKCGYPTVPVIIEFPRDSDRRWETPREAFDLLRNGAYVCICPEGTEAKEMWEIIDHAVTNEPPYEPILSPTRPQTNWSFMSMTFNSGDQSYHDYQFAVVPTMLNLQLGINLANRIVTKNNLSLRERVHEEIRKRSVMIAQISSHTANTMYEIGYASALDKTIVYLRRRGSKDVGCYSETECGHDVPALLEGMYYILYSSMTELAMKLFFGFGGTQSDLMKAASARKSP